MIDQISFSNSIPYLIFLIMLIMSFFIEGASINKNQSKLKLQSLIVLSLLIFIGLRGHIYSDWYSYYPDFKDFPTIWNPTGYGDLDMEPGFVLYTTIIKSIYPNYFFWVFINTAIDIIILSLIFKKYTKYFALAFIVFFVMNGLYIEFNLYRNSKAIILFLMSIKYLEEKRFIPYLALNIIACLFHLSSLLFIPLYFILNRKIPKAVIWSIFIISNIIFIFHIKWLNMITNNLVSIINISMVSNKVEYYSSGTEQFTFSVGYLERIISFIVFTLYYNKLVANRTSNNIFYNLFIIYFILILNLSEVNVFAERFSMLFVFSYWILYPNIYECVKIKFNKYVFIIIFFTFSFLRTFVANINPLAKYDNLIFGIESFEDRKVKFLDYTP